LPLVPAHREALRPERGTLTFVFASDSGGAFFS
jgi:hypothetical protein